MKTLLSFRMFLASSSMAVFALPGSPMERAGQGNLKGPEKHFSSRPVSYRLENRLGIHLKVVDVNLNDPRVRITAQVAANCPHDAEPVETLLRRSKPTAAINGTFFSKEGEPAPIGDIVIGGRTVYRGDFKTALTITREKQASVQRHTLMERVDWSPYETVICCSPALVLNGIVDWEPDAVNHHDPHATGRVPRMGVGITANGHLLLVAAERGMYFGEWAMVMKELGCRDAINMDSGASCTLYYRGNYIKHPGRPLTNLLLIYEDAAPPSTETLAPKSPDVSAAPAPPPIPEAAPDDPSAVTVSICGESHKKASRWCPTAVMKRIKKLHVPGPCRLHRPPPGEKVSSARNIDIRFGRLYY